MEYALGMSIHPKRSMVVPDNRLTLLCPIYSMNEEAGVRKVIPILEDGSISVPSKMVGDVFGRAKEVVVHVRSGCIVLSPIYVDLDSGALPQLIEAFHKWEALNTVLTEHFDRSDAEAVQFEGDLSILALSDVFLFLSASKKTGVLLLDGDTRWGFFFDNGSLVHAAVADAREGLAAYLLRRRFISEQDLAQSLDLLGRNPDGGAVLKGVSGLSREEFSEQRIRCAENSVYQVFTFEKGGFSFRNGVLSNACKLDMPMTTTNYVMEATRRIDEWVRLKDRVPPPDAVLEIVEDITASTKLSFEEDEVLSKITGTRSVDEILAVSKVSENEGKKALASLIAAGLARITKESRKTEAPKSPPPTIGEEERESILSLIEHYNNVFSTIYQALSMEVGNKVEVILGAFFKGLEAGKSLLAGMDFNAEGMLPAELLLERTARLQDNREASLVRELNELLYFQLFAVKNTLGEEMEAGIVAMAKNLLNA